jgi:hypothetical protein
MKKAEDYIRTTPQDSSFIFVYLFIFFLRFTYQVALMELLRAQGGAAPGGT